MIKKLSGYGKKLSYLKDSNNECKKAKGTKKCVIKRKLKFEDYKKCLKASQNIANYLEKKEIGVDSLKDDKKEFIKNRLILRKQQSFKSEKFNVFTEEIKKIAPGSNDNKRIQLINSVEIYAHGIGNYVIWQKEKIKHINIMKQYQNV